MRLSTRPVGLDACRSPARVVRFDKPMEGAMKLTESERVE